MINHELKKLLQNVDLSIEQLANVMYETFIGENTQENPAFPNHTDKDIWIDGFKNGYKAARFVQYKIDKTNN